MEISKMWTLSTAHITKKTNDLLTEWAYPSTEGPFVIYKMSGGYLIYVPYMFEFREDEREIPEDLETLISIAIGRNLNWIYLDCDGETVNCLKTYEW